MQAASITQSRKAVKSGVPSRPDQAALAKRVGERLCEARKMAGFNQLNAAKHLGYANSSKLAKIEGGKDSNQIPIWVLKRAACLYDCSVDYLIGNTETMEVGDARRATMSEMMTHMREDWERMRERDVITQQGMVERIVTVENTVTLFEIEAAEAEKALARLIEINPKWSEIKGGSRVEDAVARTAAAARTARHRLNRHRRESRAAASTPQRDLVFT